MTQAPDYVMVPREPTLEMLAAAPLLSGKKGDVMREVWKAMIAAAPKVPDGPVDDLVYVPANVTESTVSKRTPTEQQVREAFERWANGLGLYESDKWMYWRGWQAAIRWNQENVNATKY